MLENMAYSLMESAVPVSNLLAHMMVVSVVIVCSAKLLLARDITKNNWSGQVGRQRQCSIFLIFDKIFVKLTRFFVSFKCPILKIHGIITFLLLV